MVIDVARLLIFPALMAFAASSDLLTMTISNRVIAALIVGFIAMAVATGMPLDKVLEHGGAGLIVLTGGFVLFVRGWIGGGDAKLAAAIATWFGFSHLLEFLLYASLLGGVLTFAVLQFRKVPLPLRLENCNWVGRLHHPGSGVPYGIALAGAALLLYPATAWMEMLGR